ncbi:uncharacterized protein LOC126676382 [Mercurialis annua]|uniref:uncharacterized protein LOC126676382 n=1 Tax=Mercurialis annua TaxID=3986 RepID=UPI0024AF5C57|nr:uncharacterized protein LOC126676382 [Mercurialis annua]
MCPVLDTDSKSIGGKDGNPPNLATIFLESRQKNGKLIEPETIEKYEEILEVIRSDPSLPNLQVGEKCFGYQCHSHVVGFDGGIKRKDLNGSSSKKGELEEENRSMKARLISLEEEF